MIEIAPLNLRDVLHVCENMRLRDWAEVLNMLPVSVETPEVVAMITMQVSSFGCVAKVDGEPAAVAQYAEILNGSWRIGMFGTERFKEVAATLIAHMIEHDYPYLLDRGAVYCDAYADVLHPDADKLLRFAGFRKRTILEGYGSRGRDMALYVATKGEVENVLRDGRRGRRLRIADTNANTSGGGGD